MKLKGNGGYQIIDFEGTSPATLDVSFFNQAITRGKPLWVNNLVVDGETYQGVASAKKTATAIILAIATITITILLADGSATYEAQGGGDCNVEVITCDTTTISQDDLDFIKGKTKPCVLKTLAYYDTKDEEMIVGTGYSYYFINVVVNDITFTRGNADGVQIYSINGSTGEISFVGLALVSI